VTVIVGIGVDVVDIARFERAMSRTPRLRDRLFTASEQILDGKPRPFRSLAGRFAAKEALIKALGGSDGVQWHDLRVVNDEQGNPSFEVTGGAASVLESSGITAVHLSMSHDAGIAIAYVVVES
jgi:holo-[acyl-carrier protein] synthase